MRSEDLDQLGQVKIPLSSPVSRLIGRKYIDDEGGVDCMGIWECSPGRWQRTIMEEEFAHFIAGSARFIPDEGEPIDIEAGDTVWFPRNTRGMWEIKQDVRKVYVVIGRPNVWRRLRALCKRFLSPPAQRRAPEARQDSNGYGRLELSRR
ncbi:MAG: DUF861 domain-containing protein [Alphaproteobacteria bacterium]|nr:DUF861 domain-containing protein [Alphaproteobacteria bacterium]